MHPFPRELNKSFFVGIYWKRVHNPTHPARINRSKHQLKAFMDHELTLATIRVNASITRVPDRYSNQKNAALRAEHARVFGLCIGGQEQKAGWLYVTLPFQVSLLTDPVLYVVAGGLLVLDHPTRSGASEFAFDIFDKSVHVHDLPRHWSLYENRYPRIIACPRKREDIALSYRVNRLMACDFFGPFAKEAA